MADETIQIIPYYAHPHVHTVINDNTFYSEDTSTPTQSEALPYSTCIVAGADSGIDNTFVRLQNIGTKSKIFGRGNYKKYGQASIQADVLFNGNTDVWFMRVLPDNATYANMVLLAKYKKSDMVDEKGNPTGKKKLDIKFEVEYAAAPKMTYGARTANDIQEVGESFTADADPITGYITLPIYYVRSTGRGKYGNQYSISLTRDVSAESDYEVKMYDWNVIASTNGYTAIKNVLAGSLYQTVADGDSTLISDYIRTFAEGSCPVDVYVYEDNFEKLYDFYQEIVEENGTYVNESGAKEADVAEYQKAADISIEEFDPIFGLMYNTKSDEIIPYYQNYTAKPNGYVAPTKTVALSANRPTNVADWPEAAVGNTVLVTSDELNGNLRWQYTVIDVDTATGTIVYDEGVQAFIDDDQYNGVDLTTSVGIALKGGSDGDFEQITVNGVTRAPTAAEMKLLIAKEQVKAFRGQKDNKILSPYRINLDFIFDANYNMTGGGDFRADDTIAALYNNSTVLTDSDYKQLAAVSAAGPAIDVSDINVKQAMYDLNEFRNRNGMKLGPDHMAGCLLHLDCGVCANVDTTGADELKAIFDAMSVFTGRCTSIDLGYYEIYDPYTNKREQVTVSYFIAQKLIPHLMTYGLNKPFVYTYAQMTAIQRDSSLVNGGDMIRDSFRPSIDIIDYDLKELLYASRINYWLTQNEGRVVQRACQNTCQKDASALLEENNVRVLNLVKKQLDKACNGYLYNWNEAEVRKGFTDAQMQIYRPWIGSMVQDINIRFEANEYEASRMMMHCYCDIKFRNIVKRIILEININRADNV